MISFLLRTCHFARCPGEHLVAYVAVAPFVPRPPTNHSCSSPKSQHSRERSPLLQLTGHPDPARCLIVFTSLRDLASQHRHLDRGLHSDWPSWTLCTSEDSDCWKWQQAYLQKAATTNSVHRSGSNLTKRPQELHP